MEEIDARLALLGAQRLVAGVWLVKCDHTPEALRTALKTLLDDWESYFFAAVDEDFYTENMEIRNI